MPRLGYDFRHITAVCECGRDRRRFDGAHVITIKNLIQHTMKKPIISYRGSAQGLRVYLQELINHMLRRGLGV